MVGFEARLAAESRQQWRESYLDYASLKSLIRDCHTALAAQSQAQGGTGPVKSTGSAASVAGRDGEAAKAAFQRKLDAEVLKVIAFYRARLVELQQVVERAASAVYGLLGTHAGTRSMPSMEQAATLDRAAAVLQGAVHETTQLLQYIALNMTAIRKILKKYAKNVEGALKEPAPGFLALQVEHPDDPGWRVLQGTFLPARVADDLQEMQQHVALRSLASQLQGLVAEVAEARAALLERASQRIPSLEGPAAGMAEEMEAMREAEAEAMRHAALVHAMPWAERAAGMFEPPPPDAFAVATLGGLLLNNLSTLLFMCNYTAVLPPTDALCVRIGVPSSYTGLIMAASDFAALFASVGISFWTQRSFREPLLFSAASCLAGNLLFVLSYQRRSLALLLLARLLNGLGSARAANRRYTADYVSKAKRTMASAAFVGASNLGMALGPLLSLPLAYLPEAELAGVPINPITAVGLVMAVLWLAFLAAAAAWFRDPPAQTPIGLARSSLVMPPGATASSLPATAGSSLSSLQQPLLLATSSNLEPAGTPAAAAAAAEAGRGLRPNARASGGHPRKQPKEAAAWRATLPGTLACTLALFVQKMVQQSYMDSLPVLTEVLYSWRASQKGLFLGVVSLAMVPVNAAVGAASARLSDRSMVLASLALSGLCSAALVWSAASPMLFFGAGVLLFVGTVVLEGTATSLMSKCIWRGFAQGVLNAGLLSTEAGTLGRFAGNALLVLAGRLTGLADRSQLAAFCAILYATLAAVCAALLSHLLCIYGRLRG